MAKTEREIHDCFAPHYDSIYRSLLGYEKDWEKRLADVLDLLRSLNNPAICDMGCGTGTFLSLLYQNGFRRLYGVDLSPNMLKESGKKVPSAHLTVASMDNTALAGDSFGLVTVISALHHVPAFSQKLVIDEAWRLLRSGGWLYISEPSRDWLFETMDWRRKILLLFFYAPLYLKNRRKIRSWKLDPRNPEYYTDHHQSLDGRVLQKLIEGKGFTDVSVKMDGVFAPLVKGALFNGSRLDELMLRFVGFLDRRIIPWINERGSQMTLIARKVIPKPS